MKNATKRGEELRALCKKLVKEHKPPAREPLDPLHALVRAAMSYDMPDSKAVAAMTAIQKEFVDLNELRVATDLEIQELLGVRYPAIEQRVAMITQSLNHIFEKEHTLSLDRLKTVSKRDARQFLRQLPGIHPFVEAYVLVYAFDGNAMPMDDQILGYLQGQGIIEETNLEEAQKFAEHHLKSDELYENFVALRAAAADEGGKKSGKKK